MRSIFMFLIKPSLIAVSSISLFYFSCGTDARLAGFTGERDPGASSSLIQAEKILKEQDDLTPESRIEQDKVELLVRAAAQIKSACHCPGSEFRGSLSLDASESVAAACGIVRDGATNDVDGDGGCWLRANAVCLAGISQGIQMGKVWITGDVIDSQGAFWKYHVANTYNGKVYDAGFDMNGVTLAEWQQNFEGEEGTTQLSVTGCASMMSEDQIFDFEKYAPSYIGQICQASFDFGGTGFVNQVDDWIRLIALDPDQQVVQAGEKCSVHLTGKKPDLVDALDDEAEVKADVKVEAEAREGASVPSVLPSNLPKSSEYLTAECIEESYRFALAKLGQEQTEYRFIGARVLKSMPGGSLMVFSFTKSLFEKKFITLATDSQCKPLISI